MRGRISTLLAASLFNAKFSTRTALRRFDPQSSAFPIFKPTYFGGIQDIVRNETLLKQYSHVFITKPVGDTSTALVDFISFLQLLEKYKIERLSLRDASLYDVHGAILGTALKEATTLIQLNIQINSIGRSGMAGIWYGLYKNKSLKILCCYSHNCSNAKYRWSDDEVMMLSTLMLYNNTLEHIHLGDNYFPSGMQSMGLFLAYYGRDNKNAPIIDGLDSEVGREITPENIDQIRQEYRDREKILRNRHLYPNFAERIKGLALERNQLSDNPHSNKI